MERSLIQGGYFLVRVFDKKVTFERSNTPELIVFARTEGRGLDYAIHTGSKHVVSESGMELHISCICTVRVPVRGTSKCCTCTTHAIMITIKFAMIITSDWSSSSLDSGSASMPATFQSFPFFF